MRMVSDLKDFWKNSIMVLIVGLKDETLSNSFEEKGQIFCKLLPLFINHPLNSGHVSKNNIIPPPDLSKELVFL